MGFGYRGSGIGGRVLGDGYWGAGIGGREYGECENMNDYTTNKF
jgi:hypothetical protein